jgi:L-histidine N-alpha-methyltransferase
MPRYTFADHLPEDFAAAALRADVLAGLTGPVKFLPPTWLYDKVGSELFEEITRLPEYYPTRAEREILVAHARDAVALSGCDALVELGSGSSLKTTLLLDALVASPSTVRGARYTALDVSEDALREACDRIGARYPGLSLGAVRADFTTQLDALPTGGRRLVAFLGGTVGNLEPAPRARFLRGLRERLRPGDHLLLGADLVKSPDVLVPAYDDAAGVTAAFDLNVLEVLNRVLDGDFARDDFGHVAVWDAEHEWIEMRLRARRAHTVTLAALDLRVPFASGEEIRTEVSAKFRRAGLAAELGRAGFTPGAWWTDGAGRFSLSLWAVS